MGWRIVGWAWKYKSPKWLQEVAHPQSLQYSHIYCLLEIRDTLLAMQPRVGYTED